jgi:hypothetical protein
MQMRRAPVGRGSRVERKRSLKQLAPDAGRFAVASADAQPIYLGIWIGRMGLASGLALRHSGIARALRATAARGVIACGTAFYVEVILT